MTALERQCADDPRATPPRYECGPYVATFDDLTADQAYGHACAVCGIYFLDRALDSVPVGVSPVGGKVFACPGCAAKPTEEGGLGFRPEDGWQGGAR